MFVTTGTSEKERDTDSNTWSSLETENDIVCGHGTPMAASFNTALESSRMLLTAPESTALLAFNFYLPEMKNTCTLLKNHPMVLPH